MISDSDRQAGKKARVKVIENLIDMTHDEKQNTLSFGLVSQRQRELLFVLIRHIRAAAASPRVTAGRPR